MHAFCGVPCRLKDTCGSLSSVLLYLAFFLPTTLNTAWLSVASGVGILIVPESYRWEDRTVEALAVVLICLVTALGQPPLPSSGPQNLQQV